ncbi:MAG: hypothetical protein JWP87_3508 [Labilithrix sp.]|nr:hypothetical protein [Labilithrix sp.]
MRKILAIAGVALTSMLFTGTAFAQGEPPPPAGSTATTAPAGGDSGDEKKIGIGVEAQVLIPIGDLGDVSGPLIGPLVRFGYRVTPPLELTVRTGYLFGLSKELSANVSTSLSIIPIWAGARYFFMEPQAGLYGAAEIALNLGTQKVDFGGISGSTGFTRLGFNVGAGYVISKELPIDIRAQFSMINLLLKEDVAGGSEATQFALGLSAGYTFQF